MPKSVIHISDAEAARDFTALLDQVMAGAEVIIEHDARPVAVVRPAIPDLDWSECALVEIDPMRVSGKPVLRGNAHASGRHPCQLRIWSLGKRNIRAIRD